MESASALVGGKALTALHAPNFSELYVLDESTQIQIQETAHNNCPQTIMNPSKSSSYEDLSIFILTLKQYAERSSHLCAQLDQLGLRYQKVYGITGAELTEAQKSRCVAPTRRHPLEPNEIACTLGHELCLQAFLKTDSKIALVFEDDADLQPEFEAVLTALLERSKGWEVLELDYRADTIVTPRHHITSVAGQAYSILSPRRITISMVGNLYTREGAAKTIKSLRRFSIAIDNHLRESFRYNIRTAEVAPSIVSPLGVESVLGGRQRPKLKGRNILHHLYLKLSPNVVSLARLAWSKYVFQRISITPED